MARTPSATPTPIPASAPAEREVLFADEVIWAPVGLGVPLLLVVTGLNVSEADTELEVVVVVDGDEEEAWLEEDVVLVELVVEDED